MFTHEINLPDKNGFVENVVLNYTNPKDYLNDNTINSTLQGQREALKAKKRQYKADFGQPIEAADLNEFKSDQFKSTLEIGDVVSYTTDSGDIAVRIWTGNRYIN